MWKSSSFFFENKLFYEFFYNLLLFNLWISIITHTFVLILLYFTFDAHLIKKISFFNVLKNSFKLICSSRKSFHLNNRHLSISFWLFTVSLAILFHRPSKNFFEISNVGVSNNIHKNIQILSRMIQFFSHLLSKKIIYT